MNIGKDKAVEKVIRQLKSAPVRGRVDVCGTWGSFAPMLTSYICSQLKRPILLISPHIDDSDNGFDDLSVFSKDNIVHFPAYEGQFFFSDATDDITSARVKLALELAGGEICARTIISTSIQALVQPIPSIDLLKQNTLTISAGLQLSPEKLCGWLFDNGFEKVERIDMPGQFASRGGIIDVFCPVGAGTAAHQPIRIEFFGDTVESIRTVNLDTLRSTADINQIDIISTSPCCSEDLKQYQMLIDLMSDDTIVVFNEPVSIEEVVRLYSSRVEGPSMIFGWDDFFKSTKRFTQLHISRFALGDEKETVNLGIKSIQQYQHRAGTMFQANKAVIDELVQKTRSGSEIFLYSENNAEVQRIGEIIKENHKSIPANFHLPVGFIHQGFEIPALKTIVAPHHELFGQAAVRRKVSPARLATAAIDSYLDLEPGDYVVHADYGIAKFCGMKTISKKGVESEFVALQFADKVKIHLAADNIGLIEKYIGTGRVRPKLSKIGSSKWANQKKKIASSVKDIAVELLDLQAKRQNTKGIRFDKDSRWQVEFEQSFLYQETADQITAAEQIKQDMHEIGCFAVMWATVRRSLLCGRLFRRSIQAGRLRCLFRRRF